MKLLEHGNVWARTVKRDVHALWLAARDPRTPWYARMLALAVALYAVSPLDLIPDFIPVLGHLDDILIVPLGILLAVRLIPPTVMEQHRVAATHGATRPASRWGAAIVVVIWLVVAALVSRQVSSLLAGLSK